MSSDSNTLVKCRLYKPSDYATVARLFRRGIHSGRGSAYDVGKRLYCTRGITTSIILVVAGGLALLMHQEITATILFSLSVMVALFTWCYVIISDRFTLALVDHVLATELADISSYYGLTQASSEDTSPAFQSTLAESPSGFWVAVTGYGTLDEKIVGCVGLDFDKQTESGIVRRMSVDETARKLGIGRKLLDTLFAHASSHNVPRITLETSQFQPAAITFYSRYGFTKDRTEYIPILSLWGGLLPIYGFEMYYYSKLLTKPTKA